MSVTHRYFGVFIFLQEFSQAIIKLSLIKLFRIGRATGPLSAVLALGLRHWANTADLGPVTGLIRNYLINNIILIFI